LNEVPKNCHCFERIIYVKFSILTQLDTNEQTYSNVGPIRWMAPESIGQHTYSKQSDVWTFGIVGNFFLFLQQVK
jgi:serine/threonine protein kinase